MDRGENEKRKRTTFIFCTHKKQQLQGLMEKVSTRMVGLVARTYSQPTE